MGWADMLPQDWAESRLGRLARIYAGGTPDKAKLEYWQDGTIPWINSGAVNQGLITKFSALITEEALSNSSARWVQPGALVIALAGQGKTKGMVAQMGMTATCNQSMAAIAPRQELHERYLYWWIVSNYQNIRNMGGGDLRDGLNLVHIGSIPVPVPSTLEQQRIADYLDAQTAKIDALIGKQEKLIETLAERRQAVISHAVTKGLDPNSPMKDSGSLWFPTIPGHWELVPCSAAAVLIQTGPFGSQLHSDEYISGGTPVINPSHIVDGRIVPDDAITVNDVRDQELARHRLRDGDIVAARRGDLGRSAVVRGKSVGYLCGTGALIIRLKPEAYVPGYFQLIFSSGANRAALTERSVGATMDNLNADIVSRLRLPRPPVDEQSGILDHLDPETSKIDALSAKAQEMIEVLRERRQALISAAVTGKIDVRGLT